MGYLGFRAKFRGTRFGLWASKLCRRWRPPRDSGQAEDSAGAEIELPAHCPRTPPQHLAVYN